MEQCEQNPAFWPARVEVASSMSWTQGMVQQAGWAEWLASLPLEYRATLPDGSRVLCVHASPGCDEGPGLQPGMSNQALESLAAGAAADLMLAGHTHRPVDVTVDGVHLVNAGPVSNAFPPDLRASYLLLEASGAGYRIRHRRVDYDREAVIGELRRANHPAGGYIVRLMRGEIYP
jgi:diadenosine tetraphosphatase ApaH/serine/threonine PP2A family protein phosphatase